MADGGGARTYAATGDASDPRESIAVLMIVFARRDGEVKAAALDYIEGLAANRLMSGDAAGLLARARGDAATLRDPAEAVCRLGGGLQQRLGNAQKGSRRDCRVGGGGPTACRATAQWLHWPDLKRRLFQA
ncbi:MAG: hypothetical protein R3D02_02595 [Hyphomicrobiales bacterium]